MALNFPASPTLSQKYPASPVEGIPTYTWDGEKWTTRADAIAGDVYVRKLGDTMTGDLVLPVNASPAVANAVRRDFVVAKAGDTMTGHLSLPTAPAAANAVRKDYVDAAIAAIVTVPSCTVVFTVLTIAPGGWILFADQTIGDASSGAAYANVLAVNVFTALYDNFTDANCPVLTSAGGATTRAAQGTSANAWSVGHCRVTMPRTLGRALAVAGSGSGLTARAQGIYLGAETHTLVAGEGPNMTVSVTSLSVGGSCSVSSLSVGGSCSVSSISVSGSCGVNVSGGCYINPGYFYDGFSQGTVGVGSGSYQNSPGYVNCTASGYGYGNFSGSGSGWSNGTGTGSGSISGSGTGSGSISGSGTGAGATTGGGGAHNNMPPTSFLNAMIKL